MQWSDDCLRGKDWCRLLLANHQHTTGSFIAELSLTPDLTRHMYHLQYDMCTTHYHSMMGWLLGLRPRLGCWVWDRDLVVGSGTETRLLGLRPRLRETIQHTFVHCIPLPIYTHTHTAAELHWKGDPPPRAQWPHHLPCCLQALQRRSDRKF